MKEGRKMTEGWREDERRKEGRYRKEDKGRKIKEGRYFLHLLPFPPSFSFVCLPSCAFIFLSSFLPSSSINFLHLPSSSFIFIPPSYVKREEKEKIRGWEGRGKGEEGTRTLRLRPPDSKCTLTHTLSHTLSHILSNQYSVILSVYSQSVILSVYSPPFFPASVPSFFFFFLSCVPPCFPLCPSFTSFNRFLTFLLSHFPHLPALLSSF